MLLIFACSVAVLVFLFAIVGGLQPGLDRIRLSPVLVGIFTSAAFLLGLGRDGFGSLPRIIGLRLDTLAGWAVVCACFLCFVEFYFRNVTR